MPSDIVERLLTRAYIRETNQDRKSVQEGKPDRIAELLREAAEEIIELRKGAQIEEGDLRHRSGQS